MDRTKGGIPKGVLFIFLFFFPIFALFCFVLRVGVRIFQGGGWYARTTKVKEKS